MYDYDKAMEMVVSGAPDYPDHPELVDFLSECEAKKSQLIKWGDNSKITHIFFHSLIVDNLTSSPVTCTELYNDIVGDLPSDMTKGKVQYALNNLWQDEIVKIPGKPNTYRIA